MQAARLSLPGCPPVAVFSPVARLLLASKYLQSGVSYAVEVSLHRVDCTANIAASLRALVAVCTNDTHLIVVGPKYEELSRRDEIRNSSGIRNSRTDQGQYPSGDWICSYDSQYGPNWVGAILDIRESQQTRTGRSWASRKRPIGITS